MTSRPGVPVSSSFPAVPTIVHLPDAGAGPVWPRTGNAEVAADLAAETFAAALDAKHRFKPGGPPARAWLFGIAVKKLADYRRSGYAEDRARRRLGLERIEPTEADSGTTPTSLASSTYRQRECAST
jgi:DNA-directed RNA polymerase specialized sigma24 family protein